MDLVEPVLININLLNTTTCIMNIYKIAMCFMKIIKTVYQKGVVITLDLSEVYNIIKLVFK